MQWRAHGSTHVPLPLLPVGQPVKARFKVCAFMRTRARTHACVAVIYTCKAARHGLDRACDPYAYLLTSPHACICLSMYARVSLCPVLSLPACVRQGGDAWFAAVIHDLHTDGCYHVQYDDGDSEMSVARDLIEPVELEVLRVVHA
jgi:hypothetical protein